MLKQGDIVTMYHHGSNSYAQCVVLKPMTALEVQAETEAASDNVAEANALLVLQTRAEKARGDVGRVRRILVECGYTDAFDYPIYNDLNKASGTRRLKVGGFFNFHHRFRELAKREFGDRLIDVDTTNERDVEWGYVRTNGDELFFRVKA